MYAEMDYAFRAGAESLVFGQTADDFKMRLGCSQEPRSFYVASSGRVASLILEAAGNLLLPEPPPPPRHHVFREPELVLSSLAIAMSAARRRVMNTQLRIVGLVFMFSLVSNLVIRHPRTVVLGWLVAGRRPALSRPAVGPGHQGR